MKHRRLILLLAIVALCLQFVGVPSAQTGQLAPLSPEQEAALRGLYDNDDTFDQLSGAYRTMLELRFGRKKPEEKGVAAPQPREPLWSAPSLALANSQVNNPAADTTAQDTQSESALVLAGSTVVSAFNDSGSFVNGSSNRFTGFARSTNSGASWTDGGVLPGNNDAGDPVLARDAVSGRIYLSTLEFNTGNAIQIFRSDDGGQTWSLPVNGAPGRASTDKEWITVDNFPGVGQGNVYHAFRDFAAGNGIFFMRSTDQGATYSPSGGILIASGAAGNVQGAFVTVGPDHAVYVFWYDESTLPRSIRVKKSTDRGLTFGPVVTVGTLIGTATNGDLGLNGGFRSSSFPHAAVNPANGHIYVVYNDIVDATDRGNVILRRSTDGGATWSPAQIVNDDGVPRDQFIPTLAVTPDGSRLFITWYDRRNDAANLLIERFGVIGTIAGGNPPAFGPNFAITNGSFPPVRNQDPVVNPTYMGDYDQATADNSFFYLTWGDNRLSDAFHANQPDIRFARVPVAGPGGNLTVISTSPTAFDGSISNPVTFTLRNQGTSAVTGINATLTTSTANVNITQANSAYLDLVPGATAANATPFAVTFTCAPACPAFADLTLTTTTATDGTFTATTRINVVPRVTITDVGLTEGNAGIRDFAFTVSLSGPGAVESRVTVATANGSAVAGAPGAPVTFTSAGGSTIPAGAPTTTQGPAAPYPLTTTVSGVAAPIGQIAVRLNGLSHTFPADLDFLLVGPGGQRSLFMSDIGGGTDVVNVDLTFQDGAPAPPGTLVTGTYAPTNLDTTTDALPAPAPAGPHPTPLSAFNGSNPNGTWSLFVFDDAGGDVGSLTSFSLIISPATGDYGTVSRELIFPAGTTSQTVNVGVIGDATVEPNETFAVNLSAPVNMLVADGQGIGTIFNDDGATLPTAAADAYSTPQNATLAVPAPGVLANDNPNGGGPLTALPVSGVAHGSLALDGSGGFTYTPTAGYTGPDSFTYFASNALGGTNTATVSLSVIAIPPPTTVNDAFSTPFNAVLNITAPGVLANDNANGGGAMTAEPLTTTSSGTLTLSANGGFSYTPSANFVGNDTFTYRAVTAFGTGNPATATITVSAPTTVQAPFNLRVDSVAGNRVTLRWDTLPVGPQASTFVLEGGRFPGEVLASIATNSPSPVYTFVAPTGAWSIRMFGQLGSDRSPASNEVPLFVNVPVAPSPPTGLLGLANGGQLDLTWKNTFGGGAPTGLVLDVTGAFVGSLPLGATEQFTFAPVPGGTYTFALRGTNGGGAGAASAPLTLTFPGACVPPDAPANFLGYRVGNTAFVIWDPPAAGAAPTSYQLEVSGNFVGTFATSERALSGSVSTGNYNVRVRAVNGCGVSPFTPTQTIAVP